jgi:hypothetical protein
VGADTLDDIVAQRRRDLTRLPGYAVASVLAFDMFPQTAHVETVCELVPEAA